MEKTPKLEALVDDEPTTEASLSPAVAAIVRDVFEPGAHSLALALTRTSAAAIGGATAGDADARDLPGLAAVGSALVRLGGYARLRRDGRLVTEQAASVERDASTGRTSAVEVDAAEDPTPALLASDYLHASAHRSLGDAPVSADRKLALYRTLTAGSADLARASAVADDRDGEDGRFSSHVAVLAGTGCALGGVVAGGSRETVDAMDDYGRALVAATESVDADGRLLERLEAVVTGRAAPNPMGDGDGPSRVTPEEPSTAVSSAVERARSALERLPETPGRERLERATRVPTDALARRR